MAKSVAYTGRFVAVIARYFLKIRQVVAKKNFKYFGVKKERSKNALKRESLIEYSGRDFSAMGTQNDIQMYLN